MEEKCKVIMLPVKENVNTYSNRVSKIRLNDKGILSYEPHIQGLYYDGLKHTYQHLYILSDDEIKEGDWIYHPLDHKTIQANSGMLIEGDIRRFGYKKVIATTDFLIIGELSVKRFGNTMPSPSQSFINVYVKEYNKGNIITEVMVEHECELVKHRISCEECGYPPSEARYDLGSIETELKHNLVPKVNPKDNTITIHKIKDSWNRKEIEGLLVQFDRTYNAGYDIPRWLDQNLKY